MPLPKKIEDWQAPWEKKDEEIDADKAKAFTYSLLVREEKAQADLAAEKKRADDAEAALAAKEAEAARKGEDDATRTAREKQEAEAKTAAEKDRADKAELKALRLEVAAEKGLKPSQAKRLVGTTKEELEADADEILEDFKPGGEEEGDDADAIRTGNRPRTTRNPLDPDSGKGGRFDLQAAVDSIPRP